MEYYRKNSKVDVYILGQYGFYPMPGGYPIQLQSMFDVLKTVESFTSNYQEQVPGVTVGKTCVIIHDRNGQTLILYDGDLLVVNSDGSYGKYTSKEFTEEFVATPTEKESKAVTVLKRLIRAGNEAEKAEIASEEADDAYLRAFEESEKFLTDMGVKV